MSGNVFYSLYTYTFAGKISLLTDVIKCALLTSDYTPNLATQQKWVDISAFEISGTGYNPGGITLSNNQLIELQSSGFPQIWQSQTFYPVGSVIIPDHINDNFLFRSIYTGYSGVLEPDFTSIIGTSTIDGSTVWECLGSSITYFTSNPVIWNTSTFNTSYAVIYDATATNNPLIALINFGQEFDINIGSFSVSPQTNLGWFSVVPS